MLALSAEMGVNTPLNHMGRHWRGKFLFGGITLVLTGLCAVLAESGPS